MRALSWSCCSTVDLPADLLEQRGIRYTCFHYFLDGVEYPDDLGKSMPLPAFYQAMVDGADTRTAQVNVEEYRTYFTELLQQGKDVLHVTLSSGISGSYNSACIAAELLREPSFRSGSFWSWTRLVPPPAAASS